MRILVEDTIAIVVDYQERLMPVMHEKEALLCNSEKLINGLNILNVPIIVSQQYTKGIGMTVESIQKAVGEGFKYFDKVAFSCLDDEKILSEIKKYNIKNIIICGIEAHVCILQTVIDCIAKGYHVIVIEDCISSRKVNDKKIAKQRIVAEGAKMATYESILFELTRKAGTDTFKLISKIVK